MKSHPWSFLLGIAAVTFAGGWLAGQSQAQQAQRPMVYELRTYTTVEGRLPALHARFRDHTMKLFARHGMKNVLYTTPLTGEQDIFGHKVKTGALASAEADGDAWDGGTFNGNAWTGGGWTSSSWHSSSWRSSSWASSSWASSSWASSTWASSTWASSTWAASYWR